MNRKRQDGFGLIEALAGLVVFVVLVLVGTRAYRGAVHNHKEAAQVKALTDAVAMTAEKLGGLTLDALAGPGSPHLAWSEPVAVGLGRDYYRYRVVPRPQVGGAADTTVVGLEVEAGTLRGRVFTATRTFATLIPPAGGRSSKGLAAQVAERNAEAAFHRAHLARIADLTARVLPENENHLDSYNCYDPGECCEFMRDYLANPSLAPRDGLAEKCHYRCALGGDVTMERWRRSCGMDICAAAPWKTSGDCCRAISAGQCPAGSVCARVCVECVGEDGSGCDLGVCDGGLFDDLFDCASNTLCDGSPLPDDVPNWGDVRSLCKIPACAAVQTQCQNTVNSCCHEYWRPLAEGRAPNPKAEICARISSQEDCCQPNNRLGFFDFACSAGGEVVAVQYRDVWYCPDGIFMENMEKVCAIYRECGKPTRYTGFQNNVCPTWKRQKVPNFNTNPDPPPPPPPRPPGMGRNDPPRGNGPGSRTPLPGVPVLTKPKNEDRKGSIREGLKWLNLGGRE